MELCEAVLEGVRVAGSTSLDEKRFQDVLEHALQTLQQPDISSKQDEEDRVTPAPVKEALYGLSSLLLELSRADADEASISALLEECKFASDRAQYFTGKYVEHKSILRSSLARVHRSPPHLVDVQWRLDYYLKNNHVERVSRPEYLINFTAQCAGSDPILPFACTQEQLQELVLKLKDATKTLEKYTQH